MRYLIVTFLFSLFVFTDVSIGARKINSGMVSPNISIPTSSSSSNLFFNGVSKPTINKSSTQKTPAEHCQEDAERICRSHQRQKNCETCDATGGGGFYSCKWSCECSGCTGKKPAPEDTEPAPKEPENPDDGKPSPDEGPNT